MVPIIGRQEEQKDVVLYLVGQVEPVVVGPEKKEEVKEEVVEINVDVLSEIERLKARVAELKGEVAPSTEAKVEVKEDAKVPKNHRRVKSDPNRTYERLGALKTWGKVPRQQADIAAILTESMDLGAKWTEEEVFCLLEDSAKEYESLRTSKQHVTYLFSYYKSIARDAKYGNFFARDFLRMNN